MESVSKQPLKNLVVLSKSILLRCIVFGGLAIATSMTYQYVKNNTPIYSTGSDVPDAAKVGGIPAAMSHCQKLLSMLRQSNWVWNDIPFGMNRLPDQKYAENPAYRQSNVGIFSYPGCTTRGSDTPIDAGWEDIAFFTDIYARQNTSYYAGDISRSRPTGFVIVGYKSGEVKQVPIADVRLQKNETGQLRWTFPGQKIYDKNARKLPFVEHSAPLEPAVVRALGNVLSPPKKRVMPPDPVRSKRTEPEPACTLPQQPK